MVSYPGQDISKLVKENMESACAHNALYFIMSPDIYPKALFKHVEKCPTNHLAFWCTEVINAYRLNCFEVGDEVHVRAKKKL